MKITKYFEKQTFSSFTVHNFTSRLLEFFAALRFWDQIFKSEKLFFLELLKKVC